VHSQTFRRRNYLSSRKHNGTKRYSLKDKHKKAYMQVAEVFAQCSNATRLKVGSCIVKDNRVISCGYNAMPEGVDEPCELPDNTTDTRVIHSEMNALMHLKESAIGSTIFCTHAPCLSCAKKIVEFGVVQLYYKDSYRSSEGLEYLMYNQVLVNKV
jgi:dCMP deaminase